MAPLTKAKLQQIEKRVKQQAVKKGEIDLFIPGKWQDFAQMVSVRSGGNIVKFSPYEYQVKLVELMLEHSVVVAKSRQLGISETITCFMLWRACLNPGYLGVVFSKTQVDTGLLARRMKRMINSLGLKTTTENLGDIEIQGKGRILFKNSNPDSARGIESVVDVFFDEFAFVDDAKLIYDAVAPAQQMLGDKARVFIVSTPNRKANFYWDLLNNGNGHLDIEQLCENISKGDKEPFQHWLDNGGWGKVIIHWKEHPIYGHNPNFLQDVHEKQKLDWTTIKQEYDLSFTESDENVFSSHIVRANAVGQLEDVYDKHAYYYLGIDTSTTGNDYTVAIVIKELKHKYSVVHIYRKRHQTSEYHLYQIGQLIDKWYPEIIAVEVTGGTGQIYLENLSRIHHNSKIEAVRTTGDSKPTMVSCLQLALEKEVLSYPADSPLVEELLNFRRVEKKLEAPSGKHDDIIMALSFALKVSPFGDARKPVLL
jgi:phage terminase large subunit-like protein